MHDTKKLKLLCANFFNYIFLNVKIYLLIYYMYFSLINIYCIDGFNFKCLINKC